MKKHQHRHHARRQKRIAELEGELAAARGDNDLPMVGSYYEGKPEGQWSVVMWPGSDAERIFGGAPTNEKSPAGHPKAGGGGVDR